jgi:hypothetical protein
MIWEYEALWNKSKVYVSRAQENQGDGGLFAFWSLLAFELLARATLAKVHPALLAEPIESGDHLMYAFGFGKVKNPKSVAAATVLRRCQKVVPGMTQDDVDSCMSLIAYRNEELHSGSPVLDTLPTSSWLAEYYRLCDIFLVSQQQTLEAFLGPRDAAAARTMMSAAAQNLVSQTRQAIATARAGFDALTPEAQTDAEMAAEGAAKVAKRMRGSVVACPACGKKAVITGQVVRLSEPRPVEATIAYDVIILPTRLDCASCKLVLPDHSHLHAIQLGGQYSITEYEDPIKFYGIGPEDFAPFDDYGND